MKTREDFNTDVQYERYIDYTATQHGANTTTLTNTLARIIGSNWVPVQIAPGILNGYINTRKAAAEIIQYLHATGQLTETQNDDQK